MSTQWTPAQQRAIYDEGGSLLVSAAAGSGKTAVLVERAVNLITRRENRVPADRLLILTFTYAAADELRSRIGLRLERAVAEDSGDISLRRQKMLLKRAFIGTLDAYCGQLVRENFNLLDLPPDVSVGDAALMESLSQAAIADALEEMYGESRAFCDFAALYGRARSDDAARGTVLDLYEFTRSLPHPKRQLNRLAEMYHEAAPVEDTAWGRELLVFAEKALAAAKRLGKSALAMAAEEEALAGYLDALNDDLAAVDSLAALVKAARWDDAHTFLSAHKFPSLKAVRGYEGGVKDRVRALRDSVKTIFGELKTRCFVCTDAEFKEDLAAAAPMVDALCEAASEYEARFYAAKLDEKVLDFADFEHLALSLLQDENGNRTPLADVVAARYDAVMVDEYQDTNELQSALYESLARAGGDNLFYVGDVKQSIYRFRKANPGLFLQKKNSWAPIDSGLHPAVLTLGHNFRSGAGVIGGVNFLFSALMSPALGDIEYGKSECLIQGVPGGDEHGFELRILEDATGGGDEVLVARRIKQLVAEGYPVKEGDAARPCNYGDFCVLLRARGRMLDYTAALEAEGIPVMADMAGELLETPEVLPLAAMLAAIDNPADDVSLTAALLGPLLRFTPDELARLRAEKPWGGIWGALTASAGEKAQNAVSTVRFYRTLAAGMPVGRLCEELVDRTGYLSAVAAMEGGSARLENLRRFLGWAAEVSGTGRGGLAGFVRLLQAGKGPAEPPAKSLPGHVTILTIHKSKGLEFPVCILADTARRFNRLDLVARVQLHAGLGLGMMLRQGDTLYATVPQLAIRSRVAAETLSEEMRVLYVALTRAKDKMIVTLPHKEPARLIAASAAQLAENPVPDPFLLGRMNSFAEWIVSGALSHPDADPLLGLAGGVFPPRREAEGRFDMSVEHLPAREDRELAEFAPTAAPDERLLEKLRREFERTVPRAALAAVPRKLSVSAIAKGGTGEKDASGAMGKGEVHILKRPSFMYKSGLTAAEKGTAQHAFMQFADFAAAAKSVEGEIGRLVWEGYLPEALAQQLDREGIRAFLGSPLYARLSAANRVLREYDFITQVPAGWINPSLPDELAKEGVLVQGIADLVLVTSDAVEIVDYKTDRGVQPPMLVRRYAAQLALYAGAVEKRLGLPVKKCTIWSFSLSREVDVPVEKADAWTAPFAGDGL